MTLISQCCAMCIVRWEASDKYFVYDFQESPTGELVDYSFIGAECSEQESSEEKTSGNQLQADPEPELDAQACETFCVSEKTDGKNSEEGEFILSKIMITVIQSGSQQSNITICI